MGHSSEVCRCSGIDQEKSTDDHSMLFYNPILSIDERLLFSSLVTEYKYLKSKLRKRKM